MIATLMNRTVELFDIEFSAKENVTGVTNIRPNIWHLIPNRIMTATDGDLPVLMDRWFKKRCLPASRTHFDAVKRRISDIESPIALSFQANALSLSDQYWLRFNTSEKWEDLNFFDNPFSDDIGRLIVEGYLPQPVNLRDPINNTDGVMPKCWKIREGTRILLKGTYEKHNHESYREVFASLLFSQVLAPSEFVMYSLLENGSGPPLSCCDNFITSETALTSIHSVLLSRGLVPKAATYRDMKSLYGDKYHILDWMLLIDRIVLNVDRHLGNFGFIRSAITGEILCPAPIFDTGASLFVKARRGDILDGNDVFLKPFQGDWDLTNSEIDFSRYEGGLLKLKSKYEDLFHKAFGQYIEYTHDHYGISWQEQILIILERNINHLLSKC